MDDPHGHRRRVAEYLAEHGPTWGDAASSALGLTDVEFWAAVNKCAWFKWPGNGNAGWVLSDAGREALAQLREQR